MNKKTYIKPLMEEIAIGEESHILNISFAGDGKSGSSLLNDDEVSDGEDGWSGAW